MPQYKGSMITRHINIRIVDINVRLSQAYPKREHLIKKPMVTIRIPKFKVRLVASRIKIATINNPKRLVLHLIHIKVNSNRLPLLNNINSKNASSISIKDIKFRSSL